MVGKRDVVATAHFSDDGGNTVKRVRLARKTCPRISVHDRPDPGLPTPKRWKRLAPPDSSGAGREVGVPRHLFSTPWGWLRSPLGTPGTCSRRQQAQGVPAGQSSRRDQCAGTGPFN